MNQVPSDFEVRCPIHGSIGFNHRELTVISHPLVQRLRYITQLGFASLVYPGATHTRFSHALGVMHLAGDIFQRVAASSPDTFRSFTKKEMDYFHQIVRFAGLLHDSGHFPYSHSFEKLFPAKKGLPTPRDWYSLFDPGAPAVHEDFSAAVAHGLSEEPGGLLSLEEAQDVATLFHEDIRPSPRLNGAGDPLRNIYPLLKQIISGEIDADRMDYLRRDSHFTGVPYGLFDHHRLIQGLGAAPTPKGLVMTLQHNTLYTYENYLLARLHMTMQVYYHKTLLPFEYFLSQAVLTGEISLSLDQGMSSLIESREDVVSAKLFEARNKPWAGRIVGRKPMTRLIQLDGRFDLALQQEFPKALSRENIPHVHLQEERKLSNMGSGHQPPETAILVDEPVLGKSTHRPLAESSTLLRHYNQVFQVNNIYVDREYVDQGRAALGKLLENQKKQQHFNL